MAAIYEKGLWLVQTLSAIRRWLFITGHLFSFRKRLWPFSWQKKCARANHVTSEDTRYNHLTNRFHVAVCLLINRSQITSKCGKNKKVAYEAIVECVTDVLTTFWRLLWSITEKTQSNMDSICLYNNETNNYYT